MSKQRESATAQRRGENVLGLPCHPVTRKKKKKRRCSRCMLCNLVSVEMSAFRNVHQEGSWSQVDGQMLSFSEQHKAGGHRRISESLFLIVIVFFRV